MKLGAHWVLVTLASVSSARAVQTGITTSTIYVGRHFEVRDHDQPTKYVFNRDTRVAEITGSLSANLRVQRLRLYPGWNLCSLAVGGPFPASGAEVIGAAYQWNTAMGDYSQVTVGQSLAAGTVLWLKAWTNSVVTVLGTYVDPVSEKPQAGGRYVAGTGLEAWSPALPNSAAAWSFYAGTHQWLDDLPGDLAALSDPPPILSPGDAIFLQAAQPASLVIPDPSLRIRYYHQDHLGSSSVITDATGQLVSERAFFPSGLARNQFRLRQLEEAYAFTQKERDRESGLLYFEARYLAGALSRFLSPDSRFVAPDLFDAKELEAFVAMPQGINLYAYVQNNPLKYTDPTGLEGKALIIIGAGQEQIKKGMPDPSDKAFDQAVSGMFESQTKGLDVTIKHVKSGAEITRLIKSGSWQVVAYFGHGFEDTPALSPGFDHKPFSKDELAAALKAAKPKNVFLLGCTAGLTGLARGLSKDLKDTSVSGTFEELDVTWEQGGKTPGKIDVNRMTPNQPFTEYRGGFQMDNGKIATQRRRERGDPIVVDPNAPIGAPEPLVNQEPPPR